MLIAFNRKRRRRSSPFRKLLRIMKLTLILLTAVALQVSARGHSQSITLSFENVSLAKVFESIKQQSGYRFFYNEEQLQKSLPVTIRIKEASLEEALDLALKGQPFTYAIVNKVIVIKEKRNDFAIQTPIQSAPPPIDVKGQVLNEKEEPIEGVTVTIKGTNTGTSTDANGNFLLKSVDKDATLIFSHVSMETFELKVGNKTELAINLKTKLTALGDVTINTGYQQLPKERTTGSFTQIDGKLYNEQIGTNALERLKYISNGLNVLVSDRVGTNASNGLVIRGLSTRTLSISQPLIVMDNFPYEGDINNINPNDIESITILKDASAASIWGAKASNGVIVITTKKGKYNQKIKIDIASNVTITGKPDFDRLQNIASSDLIDVEQFLFSQGHRFRDTSRSNHPPFSPVYEILFKERNGQLSPADANAQINALRDNDVRDEFKKYFYKKAVNQQYAINVSGGSANYAWTINTGYDRNMSELSNENNRFTLNLNNSYRPVKNLELTVGASYAQNKSGNGKPVYGSISAFNGSIPVYFQFADKNGNALPLYRDYRQGYIDTAGGGKLLDWRYYPLTDYKFNDVSTSAQILTASMGVNYKMFDFLNVNFSYRYQKQQTEIHELYDANSYFARDLVNSFSQLDRATGVVTYIVPRGGVLDISDNILKVNDLRGQVNFSKYWGKHDITAIAGSQISERKIDEYYFRTYGYNRDILSSAAVDYVNRYPHFITNRNIFIPQSNGFNKQNNRFVSLYFNAAYIYDKRYSFSVSARRDASNLFGLNTNDKWEPFWSIGTAWNISNESFYKSSLVEYLNFRATYGYTGNVDPKKVAATTIAYQETDPNTLLPYGNIQNFYNPELRWEQTGMLNIGIDFRMKGKRISGSVEFYRKNIKDLYGIAPADITAGLGPTVTKNVGSMTGNGFDIQISSLNIDQLFKWSSTLIVNTYKDKVTDVNLESPESLNISFADFGFLPYKGYPTFGYFAYKSAGLDPASGDPQGYLDGQVSKDYNAIIGGLGKFADVVYIGSSAPTFFGSLGNTFTWKRLSLTAQITYKLGYYFNRPSINYSALVDQLRGHSDYSKRWQKQGDEEFTDVPSFVYPADGSRDGFYLVSEVLATRADNIRLQYVTATYDINTSKNKRLPFRNLQLVLNINDIGIIWKANKLGLDPDALLPRSTNAAFGIRMGLK